MDLSPILHLMVEKKASDAFITAGTPPSIKLHGRIVPVTKTPLTSDKAKEAVFGLMSAEQQAEFLRDKELNFAIESEEGGRFRVSAFFQRGHIGMVLRRIETDIPTLRALGLPPIVESLAMTKRGLIILTGSTGSGKSSTLAAMLGHRNQNTAGHIITIEDPIEFIHPHGKCIVTQREVGLDTSSFEVALKNTLRQAPDVIIIGEVRTRETMEHAIAFAETGHLCLITLHANNANQALDRIMHFFPGEQHQQIWMDLSLNLRGIVGQQLMVSEDRKRRHLAAEIFINTPLAADLVRKGEPHELKALMERSQELGMQTFDQALFELYNDGKISYEDALASADSGNNLRLMIKLRGKRGPVPSSPSLGSSGLSAQLEIDDEEE